MLNSIAKKECLPHPEHTLKREYVQTINLSGQEKTLSGNLKFDQDIGYVFESKAGRTLQYNKTNNICLWLYDPETTLLENFKFPKDGKYTLQLGIPQGSTDFNLSLKILDKRGRILLEEEDAVKLVKQWLNAKSHIFAPPFDEALAAQLTTGKRYRDTIKPNGSIDWLRKNNAYYQYKETEIKKVISFVDSEAAQYPELKLTIYQDLTLYGSKGIDPTNSGPSTGDHIYYFAVDSGIWKISDYKKVN